MKAKIICESFYAPTLTKDEIVDIVPGMETDAEGIWNSPSGKLFLCKKSDGRFAYTSPLHLQIIPDESDTVDWKSFRRDAAKDILAGAMSGIGISEPVFTKEQLVTVAINCADELIKQLREDMR